MTPRLTILQGDWIEQLRTLPAASVQCCVTSPPYFGLRDYGTKGQLGLERTPEEYIEVMIEGFREVRRVLKDNGTLWLNLGDSYSGGRRGGNPGTSEHIKQKTNSGSLSVRAVKRVKRSPYKDKDLIGIPWIVAFALRDDGWFLRSEITWCKKVPMPESVKDRPTNATEKIFLFSKQPKYFYDAEAVRNPPSESFLNDSRWRTGGTPENEKNGYAQAGAQNPKKLHAMFDKKPRGHKREQPGIKRWDEMDRDHQMACGSNMRNFWVLGPEPYSGAHFATFPSEIPRRCILAGTKPGDVVIDPFFGSGTTGQVALELGRRAIGIELNPEYVALAERRCDVTPGLALG